MVPADAAMIPLMDRGFLYGETLFETMRSYGGNLFRFDEHLKRMHEGASFLGFAVEWSDEILLEASESVLAANRLPDAILRLTISRGTAVGSPFALVPGRDPVAAIIPRAIPANDPQWKSFGAGAVVLDGWRMSGTERFRAKTGNFLDNILAVNLAKESGAVEALFTTESGLLAEGAMSNVFVVIDGEVLTAPTELPVLGGITRQAVLDVCRELGISALEEAVSASRLGKIEEMWVTNTGWELLPITRLDSRPVGDGALGPVVRRIGKALERLIDRETS